MRCIRRKVPMPVQVCLKSAIFSLLARMRYGLYYNMPLVCVIFSTETNTAKASYLSVHCVEEYQLFRYLSVIVNIVAWFYCYYCIALLLRPGTGAEYCDQFVCVSVCLLVSISLEPLNRSSRNLLCRFPVAMARSFSGDVAIHYVLPVLWLTSRLAVVGLMAMRGGCTQILMQL